GVMRPLPRPSIDTGMGLERVAAVMQGKTSDYDTDLFAPLIERVAALSGKVYRVRQEHDVSMQVIADHARAATFLIADGVTPSNEWRGYVLRRIMRRAMRHGRLLGLTEPFLWRTVDWVVGLMRDAYPELATERPRVEQTVKTEEERFAETLDTGMRLIEEYDEAQRRTASPGVTSLSGNFLFKLYDTYGFPRDLAEEIFRDKGWLVTDATQAAYEAEMEAQRERARAGAAFGPGADAEAAAIYARLDTYYRGSKLIVHRVRVVRGEFHENEDVAVSVETPRRHRLRQHHTGTHLLHSALRRVLGPHVAQAGSLVAPDHLRFDFSHGA